MKGDAFFQIFCGITMVVIASVWLFFFLRGVKRSDDDSAMLSVSRLRVILAAISLILLGLFILFHALK